MQIVYCRLNVLKYDAKSYTQSVSPRKLSTEQLHFIFFLFSRGKRLLTEFQLIKNSSFGSYILANSKIRQGTLRHLLH